MLGGGVEFDAALSIYVLGCSEVKVSKRDLPCRLVRKNPKRFAKDGIVLYFHLVAVTVNKEGCRKLFFRCRRRLGSACAARVA